jgi:hypothetical protein
MFTVPPDQPCTVRMIKVTATRTRNFLWVMVRPICDADEFIFDFCDGVRASEVLTWHPKADRKNGQF